MKYSFIQKGNIQRFPMKSGWFYIDITDKNIPLIAQTVKWGLVPSYFFFDDYKWKGSILPKGQKKYFIALSKIIRDKFNLKLGDTVKIKVEVI